MRLLARVVIIKEGNDVKNNVAITTSFEQSGREIQSVKFGISNFQSSRDLLFPTLIPVASQNKQQTFLKADLLFESTWARPFLVN